MFKAAPLTHQQIFDKVVTHLLTQKARATRARGDGRCAYRGADGRRCAVGVLIPDEVYNREMEGWAISSLLAEPGFAERCGIPEDAEGLLERLQGIHDDYRIEFWAERLEDVAYAFALDFNPPD